MNRTTIPISSIIQINRQRIDLGDIEELAESIKQNGLIQPIVINQNNELIAGGRRLAAHVLLGRTEIDVNYKETITQDQLHELEIEENVKRKEMTWQERCLAVAEIHRLKMKRAALEGSSWGQRETGALLGLKSSSSVNYSLIIADKLTKEKSLPPDSQLYWKCDTMSDAWKLRIREEQDAALAEIARRQSLFKAPLLEPDAAFLASLSEDAASLGAKESKCAIINPSAPDSKLIEIKQRLMSSGFNEVSKEEAELYFATLQNTTMDFETWWSRGKSRGETKRNHENLIHLSNRLLNVNCIDYMNSVDATSRFDHIVTDPPYGIDMSMLSQQNVGMVDIDTVSSEHEVEPNKQLLSQFFPAAYNALKDNGFCVTWCDQMLWQHMYDAAISAGFKVQRWPLTWVKLHRCMNQSAQFNFTKSTEIAMVCRKGSVVLMKPAGTCHIMAAHDDLKETLGHPFVKPFDVWNFILEHISFEGQLILEPFAGRGSGVISALRSNRNIVACELNEEHYNALFNNIKEYYLSINPNFTFI